MPTKETMEFRELLVKMIKASGQELIDRAETMVAENCRLISGYRITLDFEQPVTSIPEVKIEMKLINQMAFGVLEEEGGK